VLAPAPDILLLDEPTNHLDLPAIEWLEATLAAQRGALVLISHDRRFLENLTRTTVWLDRGKARRIELGFGAFEAWRDEKLAEEEMQQHKLDRKIVAEEHWVRYGVTARRKRNVRRMAELRVLRQKRREYRGATGSATIEAAQAEKSGALVIDAKAISKAFGTRKIVDEFSGRVMRGDRIGVVGPNGSGKTTLVGILTGTLAPDAGEVRLGDRNLSGLPLHERARMGIGYLPQEPSIFRKLTVRQNFLLVLEGFGMTRAKQEEKADELLTEFDLLRVADARGETLSGGERRRAEIARSLLADPSFMLFDEPFAGIDPIAVHDLQRLMHKLREKGLGILITDHAVRETLGICDRAALLVEGRLLESGTPAEIAAS
jgi:ABC transport system ATP-binding/permease protein